MSRIDWAWILHKLAGLPDIEIEEHVHEIDPAHEESLYGKVNLSYRPAVHVPLNEFRELTSTKRLEEVGFRM